MSECNDYKPLLAGLLDQELSPEETTQINKHLNRCAACRADHEELRLEMNKLDSLSLIEPEDHALKSFWNLPYSKTFQNAGWVLVIGGYLIILLSGAWEFITSPDEGSLPQLSMMAIVIGGFILLGIVIIERILTYQKDPYKDIER